MLTIGEVSTLAIHHSASPLSTTFEDIVAWHTDPKPQGRGWEAIAYHWIILADGTYRVGRPFNYRGAHAPPNKGRLGICVVGNNTVDGDGWTFEQIARLRQMVAAVRLLVPGVLVAGHRDVMRPGHTQCPGLDVSHIVGG